MFTRRTNPNRIISDPNNKRPDKWSSTVVFALGECMHPSWTVVTGNEQVTATCSVRTANIKTQRNKSIVIFFCGREHKAPLSHLGSSCAACLCRIQII
jgi:hypothetical protein